MMHKSQDMSLPRFLSRQPSSCFNMYRKRRTSIASIGACLSILYVLDAKKSESYIKNCICRDCEFTRPEFNNNLKWGFVHATCWWWWRWWKGTCSDAHQWSMIDDLQTPSLTYDDGGTAVNTSKHVLSSRLNGIASLKGKNRNAML